MPPLEKFTLCFEVEIHGDPQLDDHAGMSIFVDNKNEGIEGLGKERRQFSRIVFPPDGFPDQEARDEWAHKAAATFKAVVGSVMLDEMYLLFVDSANYHAETMGFDTNPVGRKELVKIHVKETERRVSVFMGAKGQRSKWTRAGLERAVRHALRTLPRGKRKLEHVAAALRKSHPSQGPVSGEALGAMLRRHKIPWKNLKTDS